VGGGGWVVGLRSRVYAYDGAHTVINYNLGLTLNRIFRLK